MASTGSTALKRQARLSNEPMVLGVAGFLTALPFSVVSLRLYIRQLFAEDYCARRVLHHPFYGEPTILPNRSALTESEQRQTNPKCQLAGIGGLACFVRGAQYGLGHHIDEIAIPEELEAMTKWTYILMIRYITGISLVKISISFFLLRFVEGEWYQRLIIAIMDKYPEHQHKRSRQCTREPNSLSPNGVYSVGYCRLACIIATVRVAIGVKFFTAENRDYTWRVKLDSRLRRALANGLMPWQELHLLHIKCCRAFHIGILAASLASLRPLFEKILGSTGGYATSNPQASRHGIRTDGIYATRSGYRRQEDIPMDDIKPWQAQWEWRPKCQHDRQ
ncbi:putative Integral membrane protein [Seiridium cardinale]|uniref:Integral membrane protein n=1 Tax=Seiridium cardinale TaxID=138064 RepID=A0ABR2X7S9_9PEZI